MLMLEPLGTIDVQFFSVIGYIMNNIQISQL